MGEVVRERKLERHVANTGAATEATATKWPRQLTLQDKLASWTKCKDSNAEIQKHVTRRGQNSIICQQTKVGWSCVRGLIRSSPCGGADIKEGDAVSGFEPLAWPCLHAFSCFGIVEACNAMVVAWNSWKATTEAACAPQKRVGES